MGAGHRPPGGDLPARDTARHQHRSAGRGIQLLHPVRPDRAYEGRGWRLSPASTPSRTRTRRSRPAPGRLHPGPGARDRLHLRRPARPPQGRAADHAAATVPGDAGRTADGRRGDHDRASARSTSRPANCRPSTGPRYPPGRQGLEAEIYLYDTLAGGAGFARRIRDYGLDIFKHTLDRVTPTARRITAASRSFPKTSPRKSPPEIAISSAS